MCNFCEGHAPLIQTDLKSGHNIDVGIYAGNIIAESWYQDAFGCERIKKGVVIHYCPMCGKKLNE